MADILWTPFQIDFQVYIKTHQIQSELTHDRKNDICETHKMCIQIFTRFV